MRCRLCFAERDLEGVRVSIGRLLKGEGSRAEVRCDLEGFCVLIESAIAISLGV